MAASSEQDLLDRARSWVEMDPDPQTRQALERLIGAAEAGAPAPMDALADAFSGRLQFGTAGLRGALGPGPNRMNVVVVRQAAAGLAAYLHRHRDDPAVVIGYDARHNSDVFAHEVARVLEGTGISAMVMPYATPTPVLAYAIRPLGCAAGVMITASHNPPQDNGMKVYLGDGSQITAPTDLEISECIDAIAIQSLDEIPLDDEWLTLDEQVINDYLDRCAALAIEPTAQPIHLVYTPMHGVGGLFFEAVLERAGYPQPIRVDAQFDPDPDFPTVSFPNPEEPGAMDLAMRTAIEYPTELIIANDPDADRCAVAVPDAGGWRRLTGDEVGSLLATWLIERGVDEGVFAESIVSGTMLKAIAASLQLGYVQTLTGFKWISRVPDLVFGYEEALGYCVDPEGVRDKDGISAALLIVEMASYLKTEGRTLADALDALAVAHGVHATSQVSLRVDDLARIHEVMTALREHSPAEIAGRVVLQMDDLTAPTDDLPPTEGLRFTIDGGMRIIVRPSGTEPKIKCYLQAIVEVDGDLDAAKATAAQRLDALREAVLAWLA